MKLELRTSDTRIDLFRNRLDNQLDQRHPLFKLAHTLLPHDLIGRFVWVMMPSCQVCWITVMRRYPKCFT